MSFDPQNENEGNNGFPIYQQVNDPYSYNDTYLDVFSPNANFNSPFSYFTYDTEIQNDINQPRIDTYGAWNTTELLETPPPPPQFPVNRHRRNITEPIAAPIPFFNIMRPVENKPRRIENRSNSDNIDGVFTVRKTRNIPSNQPPISPPEPGSNDEAFYNLCNDREFTINPRRLGFIPSSFWPDQEFVFGDVVVDFFQRKNNANCRFSHKLFNAIQISKLVPNMLQYTGVEWVGPLVLKVNKKQFARLLGIHSIDGSLFHQQGNFTTHGFNEVGGEEAKSLIGEEAFTAMDFETVRLLIHQQKIFIRDCTEEDLDKCKWVSSKKGKKQPC